MDRNQRAKEIIAHAPIVTLATISADGQPRSTPVLAAFDEHSNFYWTSFVDTEHSKNIRTNPVIFISLFDPTVNHLEASGVYVKAHATELSDLSEIAYAAQQVYNRKGKESRPVEDFIGDSIKRLYKAVPEQAWASLTEDYEVDPKTSRKEITL